MITASSFAASAVRRRAPIFPGFSSDSAIKINGFVLSFRLDKDKILLFAIPITPPVVFL